MKTLFISILGTCLLASASSGSRWDEYLDDGIPAIPVELDEEERVPLFLPEPSNEDCERSKLEATMSELENDPEDAETPEQLLRLKIVSYCKQRLESEADRGLPKLDHGLKERVGFFVESVIKANGGRAFEGDKLSVPEGSYEAGILASIERRGTNLDSIKSYGEFYKDYYSHLLEGCRETHERLAKFAYVYGVFSSRRRLEPDPKYTPWMRNAIACGHLMDGQVAYGRGAYRLLEARRSKAASKPVRGTRCFNCFSPFSRKSRPH